MNTVEIMFSENLTFSKNSTLKINNYKWMDNGYKPDVEVFLCHDNKSIKVKFISFESNITINESNDNGRIWCDSCVELFLQPFDNDARYINFEINPIGAMIMSIGQDRYSRETLVYKYKDGLNLKTEIYKDKWVVEITIDFASLNQIYDTNQKIKPRANFYKCGDETLQPHYGMWNDITLDKPDFHQPGYFGVLVLLGQDGESCGL